MNKFLSVLLLALALVASSVTAKFDDEWVPEFMDFDDGPKVLAGAKVNRPDLTIMPR